MARYRGAKVKISRNFGEPVMGVSKALEKKNYPSGMHGLQRKKKQVSEYGVQLKEKQKAKYTYGLLERQFAKTYGEASRKKGVTGENLIKLLEARLDNTVYRLGIAPSRRAARQLVSHKHILVNGHSVNIPSYSLKAGDKVSMHAQSKELSVVNESLNIRGSKWPWLEWNSDTKTGVFLAYPERDQVPETIKEQLIVELYSK